MEIPNWTHLERPPSASVRSHAERVLRTLEEASISPDRIVPSADGEISFYYFLEYAPDGSPVRFASVSCTQEGEIVFHRVDRGHSLFRQEFNSACVIKSLQEFMQCLPPIPSIEL